MPENILTPIPGIQVVIEISIFAGTKKGKERGQNYFITLPDNELGFFLAFFLMVN